MNPSRPLNREREAGLDPAAASALTRLLAEFGPALRDQPQRLRALLLDEAPQCKREIAALLQALDENIPADLLRVQSGVPQSLRNAGLAQRLSSERALSPEAASWAVDAWSVAQGLSAASDGQAKDRWPAPGGATDPATAASPAPATLATPAPAEHATAVRLAYSQTQAAWRQARALWQRASARTRQAVIAAAIGVAGMLVWGYLGTRPQLEILRVDMQDRFLADGKKRDVFVDFTARNVTLKSIEVRFVKGDGNWGSRLWTLAISDSDAAKGRASAGKISYSSPTALKSTFEFVLITQDGRRSTPFEHTFMIDAPPTTPPSIVGIELPTTITVGRDFNAVISYEDPDGDVAKIERKVIDSTIRWAQDVYVQDTANTAGRKNGTTAYVFNAPKEPSSSTIEFVLIDSRGSRSQPRRVQIEVRAAATTSGTRSNTTPQRPQPQRPVPVYPVDDGRPQAPVPQPVCSPPSGLSAGEKLAWIARNCFRVRR